MSSFCSSSSSNLKSNDSSASNSFLFLDNCSWEIFSFSVSLVISEPDPDFSSDSLDEEISYAADELDNDEQVPSVQSVSPVVSEQDDLTSEPMDENIALLAESEEEQSEVMINQDLTEPLKALSRPFLVQQAPSFGLFLKKSRHLLIYLGH